MSETMVRILPVNTMPWAIPANTLANRKVLNHPKLREIMTQPKNKVNKTIPASCAVFAEYLPAKDAPIELGAMIEANTKAAATALVECNCSLAIAGPNA